MRLMELICFHGTETWLSYEEKHLADLCPIAIDDLNERGREIAKDLLRKNIIKIKTKDGNKILTINGGK